MVPLFKRIGVLILAAAIVAISVYVARPVSANAKVYDWSAARGNFYTDDTLAYWFQNLTAGEEYVWTVQEMGLDGFTVVRDLFIKSATTTASSTSAIWAIDPQEWPGGFGPDLTRAYAPLRVIDNFGKVLGQHWISRACGEDWLAETDVVGMGEVCHNNVNGSGLYHDATNPTDSTYDPAYSNIAFLHYRVSTTTDQSIALYHLNTATTTIAFPTSELKLYNEQLFNCPVSGCTSNFFGNDGYGRDSFIVISTNGQVPAGISISRNKQWYLGPGYAFDDPNLQTLIPGVYEYAILNTAAQTLAFAGTSVFLKASDNQWQIRQSNTRLPISATQRLTLINLEAAVGDVYTEHDVENTAVGTIDLDTYAYTRNRKLDYTVDSTTTPSVLDRWVVWPGSMNWGTTTLYYFQTDSAGYQITGESPPITERAKTLRSLVGLDTIFGGCVLLIFGWILGFFFVNKVLPEQGPSRGIAHTLIYVGFGVFYFLTLGTDLELMKFIFALSALATLFFTFRPGQEMQT